MLHLGAVIPNLSFAADAHYHHLTDDIISGGKMTYQNGSIAVPTGPGLGVTIDPQALQPPVLRGQPCQLAQADHFSVVLRHYQPAIAM